MPTRHPIDSLKSGFAKSITIVGSIVLAVLLIWFGFRGYQEVAGRLALRRAQAQWERMGLDFRLSAYVPKSPPPHLNFAEDPLIKPLFDCTVAWPKRTNAGANLPRPELVFKDPEARSRIGALSFDKGFALPGLVTFRSGKRVDLSACKRVLVEGRGLALPKTSERPAAAVLHALAEYDEELAHFKRAAKQRPQCSYPFDRENLMASYVPVDLAQGLARIAVLRAVAEIDLGDTSAAFDDLMLVLFLAGTFEDQPFPIAAFQSAILTEIALQPVWEGLLGRTWTAAQIGAIQARLERVELLNGYEFCVAGGTRLVMDEFSRFVRAGKYATPADFSSVLGSPVVENSTRWARVSSALFWRGWAREQEALVLERVARFCIPIVDASNHRVSRSASDLAIRSLSTANWRQGYEIMATNLMANLSAMFPRRLAHVQTLVDAAKLACAAERFFLKTGRYPESLDALVPEYLPQVPHDVMTGNALRYERTPDGRFMLYGVGWNELDDGGKMRVEASDEKIRSAMAALDWVWAYAPTDD